MALIPLMLLTCLVVSIVTTHTEKTILKNNEQVILQVNHTVDNYIHSMDKLLNYVTKSIGYLPVFRMETSKQLSEEQSSNDVKRILVDICKSYPEITGILIATEKDQYIAEGMKRISRDSFKAESWYEMASQNPEKLHIISNPKGRNIKTTIDYASDEVISIAKGIIEPKSKTLLGVILVDINHTVIKDAINNISIGEEGFVFIVNGDNEVIYGPVNDIIYRIPLKELESGGQALVININQERYKIQEVYSAYTGWKAIGVFPEKEIMAGTYDILWILTVIAIGLIIVIIICSLKVSSMVTTPIMTLQRLMKVVEDGQLDIYYEVTSEDEIGQLGHSFNHMIEKIKKLVEMVYLEQQSKRNAELKSLQEQIKPHFLYNTLDTISWMAREYEAKEIVMLVDALTNMFRIGLSHGKDVITVREEFKHVENYLYIQKVRYKNKLNYEIIYDATMQDYKVPKLILQPLVENAIYHGIKLKREGGEIRIKGEILENRLLLHVSDTGVGITPDKMKKLNDKLAHVFQTESNESFGLYYIKDRIKLSFGEEYGIKIQNGEVVGTVVTIELPLL